MTKRIISRAALLIGVVAFGVACGPNQRILQSANDNTAAEAEPTAVNSNGTLAGTSFEQDLDAMRTADFKFIIVFRRKDGQMLTAEDKTLIGANTGMQANRRRVSDDGRAVIIGGNFPFATKSMKELTDRFKMENYSKPDSGPFTSDAVSSGTPLGDGPIVDPISEPPRR